MSKQDTKQIAIIGYGYVGKGMQKVFPNAIIHDPEQGYENKTGVMISDLAIICVPTPIALDGSCNTSIVEDVVSWIETPLILIKSTIAPGTTIKFKQKYNKRICFSPEYIGEGGYYTPPNYPDPKNPVSHGFMIIGGDTKDCTEIADIFVPILGPTCKFRFMTSTEAEIVKYADNTWGATKVIFSHMLRDICDKFGANWYMVREGWLDDPRVEKMHTAVFGDNRGFGGKCYPKDLSAFIRACEQVGFDNSLLKEIQNINDKYQRI